MQKSNSIKSRYLRAMALEHEPFNRSMVINSEISPNWIYGSHYFWYCRNYRCVESEVGNIGTEYRLVNAQQRTNILAFDPKILAQQLASASNRDVNWEQLPISDVTIHLNPVKLDFNAFDTRWRFDALKVKCEPLIIEATDQSPEWLVSPDGEKAVYVRGDNLWIRYISSGDEKPLTQNGKRHCGYAVQPEARDLIKGLSCIQGHPRPGIEALWSPDSTKIFTYQLDEREVRDVPSMLYVPQDGTVAPQMIERKYSMPGDKHTARFRMVGIDVEQQCEVAAQYQAIEDALVWLCPFSGNCAWWADDSHHVFFLDVARGQKSVRLVSVDSSTGLSTILFEERGSSYLDLALDFEYPAMLRTIPATNELIWYSERTGWAHLYLYDLTTGKLKNAITTGEWRVRDVIEFDAKARELFIQIAGRVKGRNPYYREVVRVNIDSGDMTVIASGDYDYRISRRLGNQCGISPDAKYLVITRSRVDVPAVTELRDRKGKLLINLETADISGLPPGWQWPEPVEMKAADGETDIFGVLFRPSNYSRKKKYPILDFDTAMPFYSIIPTGAFLLEEMDPIGNILYMSMAALAELGFIVTVIEGRGTPYRSKAFHDVGYGSFFESGSIVDHVSAIKQLAEHDHSLDINNVGSVSIDGPGNGAVFGLFRHPEFYKVGVAFSIWDPRLVRQGEVYHGFILESDCQRPIWIEEVKNLQGKLLLITGLLDQYFHGSMTFQLVDALVKADKDFDLVIQPNGGHGWRVKNAHRRAWDYLVRHLQGVEPPKDFTLETAFEKIVPEMITEKI